MPTGVQLREDKQFVEDQGFSITMLNKERARGTWYKSDGTALPNLPVDPYHRNLYRAKGWTLKPPNPVVVGEKAEESEGQAPPIRFDSVVSVGEIKLDSNGPDTAPLAAPPKHIHVMQREIGSPCLVAGCHATRRGAPGKFKIPKTQAPKREREVRNVQP